MDVQKLAVQIIAFIVMLAFVYLAYNSFLENRSFIANAIQVDGKVIKVIERKPKSEDEFLLYHPVIEFSYMGKNYSFESEGSKPALFSVNEEVQVIFKKAEPANARIGGVKGIWSNTIVFIAISVISLLVAIGKLKIGYSNVDLKEGLIRAGKIIKANITGVEYRQAGIGARELYYIKCEWLDEERNKVYEFESEGVKNNPEFLLDQMDSIRVFIRASDPEKYYVDISFLPNQNKLPR